MPFRIWVPFGAQKDYSHNNVRRIPFHIFSGGGSEITGMVIGSRNSRSVLQTTFKHQDLGSKLLLVIFFPVGGGLTP